MTVKKKKVITDNNNIQQINKEFRDKDMPTDVLSFPGYEPEDIEALKHLFYR